MMRFDTKEEAVGMMIETRFNYISDNIMELIRRNEDYAYPLYEDEERPYEGYIWGTVFQPRNQYDADKIRKYAQEIYDKCNIQVLENETLGVFLAINGCGYDFYESHWMPLYDLLGLKWHKE